MADEISYVPSGLYDARAAEVRRYTSHTSRRYWLVRWVIQGEPYDGFELWSYCSRKAPWIWDEAVEHPRDFIIDDEQMLDVRTEIYQGEVRNRVCKVVSRVID